ncbi:XdhC family protein [Bacillus sp. SA1-12]|uniref:XdhC family protein n=1 Tax=Bacillus sp. SA1-12 TaxID=1455638 RepID=UPI000A982677|nr:XdhC family protein [Bacillus sp. SA1-12]
MVYPMTNKKKGFKINIINLIVRIYNIYEKDQQFLRLILNKKLGYLGILGSRSRAEKLLKNVKIPEWIPFPAGLSNGAEGPREIAISIMAELIQSKVRGFC